MSYNYNFWEDTYEDYEDCEDYEGCESYNEDWYDMYEEDDECDYIPYIWTEPEDDYHDENNRIADMIIGAAGVVVLTLSGYVAKKFIEKCKKLRDRKVMSNDENGKNAASEVVYSRKNNEENESVVVNINIA